MNNPNFILCKDCYLRKTCKERNEDCSSYIPEDVYKDNLNYFKEISSEDLPKNNKFI